MKNSNSLKTAIIILVIFLIIILVWFFVQNNRQINNSIIENNNVVLNETTDNGDINSSEDVSNEDVENEMNYDNDEGLNLENPQENETLNSPINIEGEATGTWYFEANFGVKLIDRESGDIIAQSYVTALDDWMTEESVDFNSTLEYEVDEETEALLILESANPSGLAENQMTYTIPVTLNPSN